MSDASLETDTRRTVRYDGRPDSLPKYALVEKRPDGRFDVIPVYGTVIRTGVPERDLAVNGRGYRWHIAQ